MKEADVSTSALFVTLTYSTDHVPITPKGWMNLEKTHLQSFFKRLRYHEEKTKPIKYYACGEYGTRTSRPHFHIILFNSSMVACARSWSFGSIHFGQVTPASVGYCLKYISKEKKTHKPNDDRNPIFNIMSKGLGKSYVENPINKKWHLENLDERYYVPAGKGVKASMPRYYRERLYNSEQFGYLKGVLERNAADKEADLNCKYSSWHIAQLHQLQFKKMHLNSNKNETL